MDLECPLYWFESGKGKYMDQKKIGQFIRECRKEKGLTQEQLAEQLGISKNAVSKWERGLCLMDMSLLKPLSEILGITVNDILAGERISPEEFEKKTEENILNLSERRDLKAMRNGITALCVVNLLLSIYCLWVKQSPSGFLSMICGYNGIFYVSRYFADKDRANLMTGGMFLVAMVLNLIAYVVSTI